MGFWVRGSGAWGLSSRGLNNIPILLLGRSLIYDYAIKRARNPILIIQAPTLGFGASGVAA